MIKEKITSSQAIAIIVLFIFGSSVIFGVSTEAKQDSWITLILATLFSLPIVFIYARIIKLYPGLGLYDIIYKLFGKIIGNIITILMIWYAIHLCSMILKNFSEYIKITTLLKTPEILIIIVLLLVAIYIGKSGPTIFGSWVLVVLPVVILMLIITIILSLGIVDVKNLMPIMETDLKGLSLATYKIISFPLAETVLFLPLACFLKKEDSPYKIYMLAIIFGSIILLFVMLRNLTVLGSTLALSTYFPSFSATRIIELGNFLTRIEGIVTINFLFAGITKITVCLIAASLGISKLLSVTNYKKVLLPTSLLILALSAIIYTNILEMMDFIKVYYIYALPFEIIIPLIIWITAEIKLRKKKFA
ncbi:MAG: GerAB/ArcD/ProY family transporter [Ignavibacteriales bacterium]